jgi:hypothetical protein
VHVVIALQVRGFPAWYVLAIQVQVLVVELREDVVVSQLRILLQERPFEGAPAVVYPDKHVQVFETALTLGITQSDWYTAKTTSRSPDHCIVFGTGA